MLVHVLSALREMMTLVVAMMMKLMIPMMMIMMTKFTGDLHVYRSPPRVAEATVDQAARHWRSGAVRKAGTVRSPRCVRVVRCFVLVIEKCAFFFFSFYHLIDIFILLVP